MRKLSIGLRLTLWYLAIFAVAQIVFGAGMWFSLRHHLYHLVDSNIQDQVDDLKSLIQSKGKDPTLASLQDEVNEAYALEHFGNYLDVRAEGGALVYRSAFLEQHPVALPEPSAARPAVSKNRRLGGKPFRLTRRRLEVNGHIYSVEMAVPTDEIVNTLSQFRFYLLMFAPLLLLLAAGGGYWLSHRALAPVDAIVGSARQISGSNLSSRLQKLNTGDELQRLSDTLNEMLERIETSFLRVTQFTADASHELRTPVALIRTDAELALRRSRGETEYKESLHHILKEAERTTVLIEQLLALARSDSGRESLDLHSINLSELMHSVLERWRQMASVHNLEFSAEIQAEECFVLGDKGALRRLLDILLDNAFKYTASPGSVHLSLAQTGDNATITVQDSGVGISTEDQGRIFERFYRVDKARSREQGGAGLGLSIAQWLVTQHRGSIEVASRPGEGSTFRVSLPCVAAPVRNAQLA
jgi:heavy metal sensor kinase